MNGSAEPVPHVNANDESEPASVVRDHDRDLGYIKGLVTGLEKSLQAQINGVRSELSAVRGDLNVVSTDIGQLSGRMDSLFTAVTGIATARAAVGAGIRPNGTGESEDDRKAKLIGRMIVWVWRNKAALALVVPLVGGSASFMGWSCGRARGPVESAPNVLTINPTPARSLPKQLTPFP